MSELENGSVLPDNRSLLERGLEVAFTQLLYEIENPYPQLLNPHQTSKPNLPYLAQDKGVTEWDVNDAEAEHRQVIANAFLVKKLSGTKAGIALALASLGGDTEIIPWHKYGGDPYHLKIRSWLSKAPTNELIDRVSTRIQEAKSERDVFNLGIGVKSQGGLFIGGAVQLAPRFIVGAWIPPVIQAQITINTGGVVVAAYKVISK